MVSVSNDGEYAVDGRGGPKGRPYKKFFWEINMPRVRNMPAAQRVELARKLIQEAREVEVPEGIGKNDFSYIARVKDLLRQAHDLVQFIPKTPSASQEMKADVQRIFAEIEQADRVILSPESELPKGSR
jgi:hypothetical protein